MKKISPLFLVPLFVFGTRALLGAEAAAPSVEERLQRIEAQLKRIESRLGDTVSADELAPTLKEFSDLTRNLGWDGKSQLTVVKAAGKETKLSVGGYAQIQWEGGGAPDSRYTGINDRILLRRARLTFKGSFAENFDFTLQSDFGNNSIGNVSGYRAQLTDAFIAWNKYDFATVQIGQFKTPFGYEQLLPDTKTLTVERSLPNDLLTLGRQIGIGVSGAALEKKVTYSVGFFNGNGVNNGNNDNDQFLYAGRVAAQLWTHGTDKLSVGINGLSSKDTGTFTGYRTAWGVDGQATFGRLDLSTEYLRMSLNRATGADSVADGWNVMAAYYVVPKSLQILARYEIYDPNNQIYGDASDAWILGLNYYIKGDDLKLSLNYDLGNPAGPLTEQRRLLGRVQIVF